MSSQADVITITAIDKIRSKPAAEMKIIFPFSHPNAAIIDDLRVLGKPGYHELLKTWGNELSKDEITYAKHGLGQFLYTKAIQWIKENKPQVDFVTGYISSKEAYQSRIKALGKPNYIRLRELSKPVDVGNEEIINYLNPANFSQQGGSYSYDNQVEVRHKIKDSTNIDPSNDKS
jgi:hypothetical protein